MFPRRRDPLEPRGPVRRVGLGLSPALVSGSHHRHPDDADQAFIEGRAHDAQDRSQDRSRRVEVPANQTADQVDARVARIRADLRLTPEQENNWAGFESAMRDIGKTRADREVKARADREQKKGPVDIIEQMHRGAEVMSVRSVETKKLADAAQPLFASLSDQQKRRLTEELVRTENERD